MDWWWIYNMVLKSLSYVLVIVITILITCVVFWCAYGIFCSIRWIVWKIEDHLDEKHKAKQWMEENKEVVLDDKSQKIYDEMLRQLESHTKEINDKDNS